MRLSKFSWPACPLPRLATYQLTALAVVAFLIDHFGSDFFSGNPWFRQLKFMVILWFFPAGYNSGWKPQPILWWGLVALTAVTVFYSGFFFPLTVLATLIAVKYIVDPLMEITLKNIFLFIFGQLVLLWFARWTHFEVMEYGSMALIMACSGWLVRHRDSIPHGRTIAGWHLLYSGLSFAAFQYLFQHHMREVWPFMLGMTLLMSWYMWDFKGSVLLAIKQKPAGAFGRAVRFVGHHSLEIFVIHLLLFKAALWVMYRA